MSKYDYIFKVLLIGQRAVGKRAFLHRFLNKPFKYDYTLTIGVDFYTETIELDDLRVKLQFWLIADHMRFNYILPTFFKGARGAIIMYDITRAYTLQKVVSWIDMIRSSAGYVPIMLVGNKRDQEDEREVIPGDVGSLIEDYELVGHEEISAKTGEQVHQVIDFFTRSIIEFHNSGDSIKPYVPKYKITEYQINKYLKLKLEYGKTNIYVNDQKFRQCKYLLFNIPTQKIEQYDEIESIDEAAEKLSGRMEGDGYYIPSETEFWGRCSNLQAWYENNYDTRILHRNLAFPLLKKLADAGDDLAKRVFKEEIALRLESGYPSVVGYLINQGYMKYLCEDELDTLIEDSNFIQNVVGAVGSFEKLPQWLSERIQSKIKKSVAEEVLNIELEAKNFIFRKLKIPYDVLKKLDKDLLIEFFEKNQDQLLSTVDVKVRFENLRSFSRLGVSAAKHCLSEEIIKYFRSDDADFIFYLLTNGYINDVNINEEEGYYSFINDKSYSRLVRSFVVVNDLVKGVIFRETFYPVKDDKLDLEGLGIIQLNHVIGFKNRMDLKELNIANNMLKDLKGLGHLGNLKKLKIDGNKIPRYLLEALGGIDDDGYAREPNKFVVYSKKRKELYDETQPQV